MTAKEFIRKTKKHIWNQIMRQAKSHNIYPYIYRSYWHYLFHPRHQTECLPNDKSYYTARPNPDAGIGHQMANWIAGLLVRSAIQPKFRTSALQQSYLGRVFGIW